MFKGKVAEELIGDLNSDTSALKGRQFDVVIDNPTTLPFWVKNAAQYLKGNVKHYIFISTTSVYRDQSEIGINENSPTVPMPAGLDPYQPDQRNPTQLAASANPANYGAFKARAEQEVQMQYPGINTVIRPCLIVGPLDRPTGLLTGRPASTRAAKCLRRISPTIPVNSSTRAISPSGRSAWPRCTSSGPSTRSVLPNR
jgi:hypothetical protein